MVKCKRDSQRSKFYKWEHQRFPRDDQPLMNLDECQDLVDQAWKRYGIRWASPKVRDGRRRSSACYSPNEHLVKLPRWSRTKVITLHEVAYGIKGRLCPGAAWHGPEFMRVFIELIGIFCGEDTLELKKSARMVRLRIAPANKMGPPGIRTVWKLEKLTAQRDAAKAKYLTLRDECEKLEGELRKKRDGAR